MTFNIVKVEEFTFEHSKLEENKVLLTRKEYTITGNFVKEEHARNTLSLKLGVELGSLRWIKTEPKELYNVNYEPKELVEHYNLINWELKELIEAKRWGDIYHLLTSKERGEEFPDFGKRTEKGVSEYCTWENYKPKELTGEDKILQEGIDLYLKNNPISLRQLKYSLIKLLGSENQNKENT